VNTNVRSGVRTDRRQSWNGDDRWRDDRGRYSDRDPRVRVGVGYDEPGYAYRIYNDGYAYGGYDDGYYSSGYSEPYATRGYSDTYYGYAASHVCTCSPAPYAAWNSGNRWDGGGWGAGFSAW
jgi:hypothetical protein